MFLLEVTGAQVVIHDPVVRLLAKPFGIEERIELVSIDGVYGASDGQKRLVFTLRSSGVKEVVLENPEFSLDLVLPSGKWASLGALNGCDIMFPQTGESMVVTRTYVANLETRLVCPDLEAYLREAERNGSRIRLVGRAKMTVRDGGRTEFSKRGLRLELGGVTQLSQDFRVIVGGRGALPEVGGQD